MATDKYIDPALVPRRNSQLGATMQMGVPPPAAKLAIAPRALPQNNPQLAATSGVAGVVPPAAAKLSVAPRRFSSGLPGVQGPGMPQGTPAPRQMPAGIIGAPLAQAPALAATPVTPPAPVQAPLNASAQGAAGVPALSRPTQTMTDKQIWDTRAKGRMVNGVQTFDSEWAKDPNNARRLELYAGNGNAVASVVPAPGVAQGMVSGQTAGVAALSRAPRGFTAEDRARQVEAMTDRGNAYRAGEAADYARTRGRMAIASGDMQRAEAVGKQAIVESGLQVAPPTASSQAMGTQRLAGQKQAVDQGNEAAKLAMDQEAQAVINEQNQAQTETQKLQLQQAQQMQALTTQLLQGTPEQKKAATASLAALQGTKAGQPIKIQREVPITDKMGGVTMQKVEGLYDPTTGTEKWFDQQSAQPAGYAIGPDGKRYQVNADGTITEAPAQ